MGMRTFWALGVRIGQRQQSSQFLLRFSHFSGTNPPWIVANSWLIYRSEKVELTNLARVLVAFMEEWIFAGSYFILTDVTPESLTFIVSSGCHYKNTINQVA